MFLAYVWRTKIFYSNCMSQAKKTQSAESSFDWSAIFPYIAIPVALVVSALLFVNVLGDPANFEGGDAEKGHPLNVLGTIHKGGFIVPLLITVNLVVIIFFVGNTCLDCRHVRRWYGKRLRLHQRWFILFYTLALYFYIGHCRTW